MSTKIQQFFHHNPVLLRLYKNASILFSGNVLSAILSLFSLTILTRSLSLELFGVYALIISYVTIIDRLTSFQSWQATIHYGSKALTEKSTSIFSSLLVFGFILDIAGSCLGFCLAILGILFIPSLFGINEISLDILLIAAITLIFNIVATPTAILRLFDKFFLQAAYLNLSSATRLIGFIVLWSMGVTDLKSFVCVWAASVILSRMFLLLATISLTRKKGYVKKAHIDLGNMIKMNPGIWRFVFTTNLDGMVRIIRELDIFVVDILLGNKATALFKIAKEITRIPTQITGPMHQAIYPELSHLAHTKNWNHFTRLIKQSSISVGTLVLFGWLAFYFFGEWLIQLMFGNLYTDSFLTAFWCIGGVVIWSFGIALSSAMLALNKAHINLYVHLATSITYLFMVWFFTRLYDISGAGFSLLLFHAFWCSSMMYLLNRTMKSQENTM